MTHWILKSYSMGQHDVLGDKLPQIKEFRPIEVYLEGIDYNNGYYTYREVELLEHFKRHPRKHPHDFEGNPLENQSDYLAGVLQRETPGKVIVVDVEHPPGTPDFIKKNYRRFQLLRR